jgi:hypothetical protein
MTTGRWVSQLKKHLCYDNSNFDKKRYGMLNQAGALGGFALALFEIYSREIWLNLFRPVSR